MVNDCLNIPNLEDAGELAGGALVCVVGGFDGAELVREAGTVIGADEVAAGGDEVAAGGDEVAAGTDVVAIDTDEVVAGADEVTGVADGTAAAAGFGGVCCKAGSLGKLSGPWRGSLDSTRVVSETALSDTEEGTEGGVPIVCVSRKFKRGLIAGGAGDASEGTISTGFFGGASISKSKSTAYDLDFGTAIPSSAKVVMRSIGG